MIDDIDYNFHTHTWRCGHTSGSLDEEDYVEAAIKEGYKTLGFSDHVFLPGFKQPGIRGDYEMLDDYINRVNFLKEKYKHQIDIHVGFEAEYMEEYADYYKELLKSGKIEYLICGQHFFKQPGEDLIWLDQHEDKIAFLEKYERVVCEAIKSGLFTYIAHPDMCIRHIPLTYLDKGLEVLKNICKTALKYKIPLEINLQGFRNGTYEGGLGYPTEYYVQILSEIGNDVVVGVDAHNPDHFANSNFDTVNSWIKKYNLKLIKKII